jgi:hypothetical protein
MPLPEMCPLPNSGEASLRAAKRGMDVNCRSNSSCVTTGPNPLMANLFWSAIPVITFASNNSFLEGYQIELLDVDNALDIKDAGCPAASISCRWSSSAPSSSSRDIPGNADAWKFLRVDLTNVHGLPYGRLAERCICRRSAKLLPIARS